MKKTVEFIVGNIAFFLNFYLLKWGESVGKEVEVWLIGSVLAGVIFLPGINVFDMKRTVYAWADSANEYNPLYKKGYFRKKCRTICFLG